MTPGAKDYRRAQHRLERALDRPLANPDEVLDAFLRVSADVLSISSACWHHTDPATGSPLGFGTLGDPAGSFEESMEYEFRRPDVNRFAVLRARRTPVGAISTVTGDRMAESARFREMIAPHRLADELRVAFCDPFGMWAAVVMFTARRMTAADEAFVADAVGPVSAALRAATLAQRTLESAQRDDDDVTSVLMLDAEDRVVAADPAARARLSLFPGASPGHVPGLISFLAAQARWDTRAAPARASMLAGDGRWLIVDASQLDGGAQVAVVMRPAPAQDVLQRTLRLLGLSAREREVARLAAQGQTVKGIAAALVISPWTVQDHLKAVYAKAGVAGRADLARLAAGP